MITPYFERNGITIYHADCRDILPTLGPQSVDLVLTDPPYSETTHAGARTTRTGMRGSVPLVTFASITGGELAHVWSLIAPSVRRWAIAFLDWRHVGDLEQSPPLGLRFVRFGVWVKPNPAPQFTGDRPGTGWEAIAFMHSNMERLRWNGGGTSSVFSEIVEHGGHPTQKPIKLVRKLIGLFTDHEGETVLDPFMGSGTTLRAAMDLKRRAIGIELEERYCEIAAKRLEQLPLFS